MDNSECTVGDLFPFELTVGTTAAKVGDLVREVIAESNRQV
jgi:hypothetical protein